jgi:transposase-like protein
MSDGSDRRTVDKRRNFSREFKLAAVKKVIEQGLSYAVARDLGVGANLIRNWKKTFEASRNTSSAFTIQYAYIHRSTTAVRSTLSKPSPCKL